MLPALDSVKMSIATGPGAFLPPISRVVCHGSERILAAFHEVINSVLENLFKNQALPSQIRVIVSLGEDELITEV